ncbi:hypothetical protein EYZ11_006250 [Aspergillus tanneri]|uniref:Alcohol O-acetyltransferase n=1 Tax=Aspergillus tanneri TaxID=1220188 RepID=A0A4S3JI86_9EURO|nr:Alcohol O-acetyltransferase [Aspergillus tanneri]KAA8641968.1 Alcohol O-acetyltransferase [Aspergillus tanneri]THC94277.1 hypothetical protein EYZ11_006250 [Aspergillus tanneri]
MSPFLHRSDMSDDEFTATYLFKIEDLSEEPVMTEYPPESSSSPDKEDDSSIQPLSKSVSPAENQSEQSTTSHSCSTCRSCSTSEDLPNTSNPRKRNYEDDEWEYKNEEGEERRSQMLERNRIAATKCRRKKKARLQAIEESIEDEERTIERMERELALLERESQILDDVIRKHLSSGKCRFMPKH